MDAVDNANMFSRFREWDELPINVYWRNYLRILCNQFLARRTEDKQLCFLRDQSYIVLSAVVQG